MAIKEKSMQVGDLVVPKKYPRWVMLVVDVFLDGKHVRLKRGSQITVGEIKHFKVINASR
tara:strand:- start:319 stop:498 length:180 start_codon:yes stop_codon:yes gene_type:complete